MALLLDTHAFLWFIDADPRLSPTAAARIGDPDERVIVSVVSAWEIVIKQGTGKLVLGQPLARLWPENIDANEFDVLNVTWEHILALSPLPLHHRDPFDRLLIAQAIAEGLQIVSADPAFDHYPVERVW
ncbi:MAG TPA: type II toxin-antitoxin system VapC family toxin [Longimicrobium sp.]|nr:type II toxin-antitoxin system VapC family toxin [Longimicrobium sp.]